MNPHTQSFDWTKELHQTMVHSLSTSFGLDFLLFEDRKGGDVDTVHKVREYQRDLQSQGQSDIHVSESIRQSLTTDGKNTQYYDSEAYHTDANYIQRGKQDKSKQAQGELYDAYRNRNFTADEKRQLDHIVSAYEIHHDAGRILADADGIALANQNSNLASTQAYINNRKSNQSISEFVEQLPAIKAQKRHQIEQQQAQLAAITDNTPQAQHEKRLLQEKIHKGQQHLAELESIDSQAMLAKDGTARKNINSQISWQYYSSSRFFNAAAQDMANKGLSMGMRQAFGLMLAEVWFELKEQIPQIYRKCRHHFQLGEFMRDIGQTLNNIWERVKARFKDMLTAFKDGAISGILSSISTIIWNAFQTIGGNAIKIIRETWNSLVRAVKLIFFNPDKLPLGDLMREVTRILGTAASIAVGTTVHSATAELLQSVPFDFIQDGLSAFVGALLSGVLTLGLGYALDHSAIMQKVWSFLNGLKSKYERASEYYQEINAELDRYLMELSRLEFNMNPAELQRFADDLTAATNEYERGQVLAAEVKRRNIELPFEPGNTDSVRAWLSKL
ncbi:ATPase [Conchiformibius steedae]|uniref:ATPase n=1 Tax=Conchiformibius steedae TaxID=153493 RepID=A0A3P2A397_9NEIS|nr:ATPase [Conchiformibius steedae]RRD89455.1 ATPase [Conchiformibius steedae]